MKKKKLKRLSVLALSLVMTFSFSSLPVYAAEMESGIADLTKNSSTVAFAGYEWWVVGYNGEGVYPQTDHITLLSANNNFGYTAFRSNSNRDYNSTLNEYAGSTLQQAMENIAEEFPTKEQDVITARDLTSSDGITGQEISGQELWALSYDEWETIDNIKVLSYGNFYWWLRSSGLSSILYVEYAMASHHDGIQVYECLVFDDSVSIRPAFSLNLESVIFTSAASEESGKSVATIDDGLTSMGTIAENSTVKFTMQVDSQTLTVNATEEQSTQSGSTLYFTYEGATTGSNQYISSVLTDEDGDVVYYGKLADSSSASSGNLSISLEGVEDGTYTLQIFSEEANDYLYTDFCSEPVTMMVTVSGGSGTVSEFGGTMIEDTTSTVENPETYDDILPYFVLSAISIIGLISVGIYFRKNMKNKIAN